MMRVALLGPANSIHLQRWAAALAQRGHAVCVISQHRCERELLPESADVVWLPYSDTLGYFRNALRLHRVLAQWRPDLLNAHYASGYGTTAALCGFSPTLLSVWSSDVYDFPYESALKGRLPTEILERRKQGFGVPLAQWFRGPLRPILEETLSADRLRRVGLLDPKGVDRLITEHMSGRQDHRKLLWTLLAFERWRESYLPNATWS